jgi:hypothetical protein
MREAQILSFPAKVANDNHWVNPYSNEMGIILHNIRLFQEARASIAEQKARFKERIAWEARRQAKLNKIFSNRSIILDGIKIKGECGLID